jgi:hypothetical protein
MIAHAITNEKHFGMYKSTPTLKSFCEIKIKAFQGHI